MNTKCRNAANTNTITESKSDMDLLDILLDSDNRDPIVLMDESGRQIEFEQVAVIPHVVKGNKELFAILKPLDTIEGIGEDEAIVFVVNIDSCGTATLRVESDDLISIEVFNKYYDLLEAATGNK